MSSLRAASLPKFVKGITTWFGPGARCLRTPRARPRDHLYARLPHEWGLTGVRRPGLGALALDDVVYTVEKRHADLFAFMGYNSGTIQLMARPGIQSARDLVGRILGVDDPDSGFAFVAHKILQEMGLRREEYETVP